jgi:non-lysosomal glucosylceramidase
MGQYMAEVAGLGPLVDGAHVHEALESVYRYNYKRQLYDHDSVERIFALNDEAAIVICDYGTGKRPEVPFPYFAEVMTGFEYQAAAHMIYAGMVREGVECIENIRRRYDGERRSPWDEAECGHHYARAMASWSGVLALSGFRYDAVEKTAAIRPRLNLASFVCFWSSGPAWGTFSQLLENGQRHVKLGVAEGSLPLRAAQLAEGEGTDSTASLGSRALTHDLKRSDTALTFVFAEEITIHPGEELSLIV